MDQQSEHLGHKPSSSVQVVESEGNPHTFIYNPTIQFVGEPTNSGRGSSAHGLLEKLVQGPLVAKLTAMLVAGGAVAYVLPLRSVPGEVPYSRGPVAAGWPVPAAIPPSPVGEQPLLTAGSHATLGGLAYDAAKQMCGLTLPGDQMRFCHLVLKHNAQHLKELGRPLNKLRRSDFAALRVPGNACALVSFEPPRCDG